MLFMEIRRIYADHAATTPVTAHARDAMAPYLAMRFGNPSALYRTGRNARQALEDARGEIAASLGAATDEIFFTSCGTESDNWALKGLAAQNPARRHIITTAVEHHAVLRACDSLRRFGWEITVLPVNGEGRVDPESVRQALRDDTLLVSVMAANNEVGTIEPIAEIGQICRAAGVPFHTDAVQAAGHLPLDLKTLPVDLLSLSGHKFGAPKGIGALYVRRGLKIAPLLDGGGQEHGLRAGTENVAGAVGMAVALADAVNSIPAETARLSRLRDRLIDALCACGGVTLNGSISSRLAGNIHVSVEGASGSRLLAALDRRGIAVSAGSACSAGNGAPSHVLAAMGVPPERTACTLRLTLGACTTAEDVASLCRIVPEEVAKARK